MVGINEFFEFLHEEKTPFATQLFTLIGELPLRAVGADFEPQTRTRVERSISTNFLSASGTFALLKTIA